MLLDLVFFYVCMSMLIVERVLIGVWIVRQRYNLSTVGITLRLQRQKCARGYGFVVPPPLAKRRIDHSGDARPLSGAASGNQRHSDCVEDIRIEHKAVHKVSHDELRK